MAEDRAALRLQQQRQAQQRLAQQRQVQQRQSQQKAPQVSSAKKAQMAAAKAARQATQEAQPMEGPPETMTHRLQVQEEAQPMARTVKPASPAAKTDWRRAIILSEVLSPPVSKRQK